jgi:alpha-N-arabinofuranosidase
MMKGVHMKRWMILTMAVLPLHVIHAQTIYSISTDKILHTIDEKVYGHFLEHIYHSVNGGLWGELVWNRTFEMLADESGLWHNEDSLVIQSSLAQNVRLLIGETDWQDYELTLRAQRRAGAEGFLVMFRADGDDFYWFNVGGWGNTSHAIEKGITGQGRWGVLNGLQVSGSVETGRWYDVRIRCEGNHFQAWLDEQPIFDFTDEAAHLSGQVGIGTWVTEAAFSDILVREIPGGDTLFKGLPALESAAEASFVHWEKTGNPLLYTDPDALNSYVCVKIVNNDAAEAGVAQNNFNFISQNYKGSFWARGTTPGGLKVKLLNGTSVLAETELPAPGNDWKEYGFVLNPGSATADGRLEVVITDTGTLYLDQVSMMGQDAIDNNGFRPDLCAAIDSLKPPVIRWPGGYFAELYRWKAGIGPQHEREVYPIEAWGDRDVNSYGTDEFIAMCRQLDAEPLMVINIGHRYFSTPQQEYIEEARHWLEYCNGDTTTVWGARRKANGHPEPYNIKLWEISNEIWLTRNVYTYIQFLQAFVPALKEIDPEIKIIACGSGGFDQNWNTVLLNQCADIIDYISTHHYENIENFRSGVISYNDFLGQLSSLIQSSSNPDIRIYMSEWNVWSPIDWRCGLYAGGMLNTFEQHGDYFEIGGPALFLRHLSAPDWNNAFINFDHSGWFPAPNYVVMKLWRDHYAPNFLETQGSHTSLNVVSTLSSDSCTLYFKVVNTSENDEDVILEIDTSLVPVSASMKEITAPSLYSLNSLGDPGNIKALDGEAAVNGEEVSFVSKAYSAAVVTISLSEDTAATGTTGPEHQDIHFSVRPNPFNTSTTISYQVDQAGEVCMRILDLSGHVLSVVVDHYSQPGEFRVNWDGKNEDGTRICSGTYLCELVTSSGRGIYKLVLLQ